MSITYGSHDLVKRIIDGHNVEKVIYNGNQIWPNTVPPTPYNYFYITIGWRGGYFSLERWGNPTTISLEYSTDKHTWNDLDIGQKIEGTNTTFYIRNKSNTPTTFSRDRYNFYYFAGDGLGGTFTTGGDITYLLCKTGTSTLTGDYCFYGLFEGIYLEDAQNLDLSAELTSGCYHSMFSGCTGLRTPPLLPVTSLAFNCYHSMFEGCTGLQTTPSLPATALGQRCYQSMFEGCTSLVTAPQLPSPSLAYNCYNSMFKGCTSLVTAPTLIAQALREGAYIEMFSGCTSLEQIPNLESIIYARAADRSSGGYCTEMFSGCTKIKISETQVGEYQNVYRMPSPGGDYIGHLFDGMFNNTGGTFTSTPQRGQTYYTSNTVV